MPCEKKKEETMCKLTFEKEGIEDDIKHTSESEGELVQMLQCPHWTPKFPGQW